MTIISYTVKMLNTKLASDHGESNSRLPSLPGDTSNGIVGMPISLAGQLQI
ncbi:MAG: hypothetical protein M0R02_12850 [Bacteroidales bacterium]|nr:hypothetical protein [Bacteroidales bacterium]